MRPRVGSLWVAALLAAVAAPAGRGLAAAPEATRGAEPADRLAAEPADRLAADAGAILLGERRPLAFLLVTPSGRVGSTRSSDIIRIVSDLLGARTDLALLQVDPASVNECRGRLGCYARKVESEQARDARPRQLLVLSNLTQDRAADRLSVLLLDLDRSAELAAEVRQGDPDGEAELEARIAESAVLARPRWGALEGEDAAREYLEAVFANDLRRAFEASGHWEPYGDLALEAPRGGLAVELDGSTIGLSQAGTTRILRVTPGKHLVRLSDPKIETWSTEVTVERGRTAALRAELVEAARSPLGRGLFWTGAGAMAAGAAIAAVAVTRRDPNVETVCVGPKGVTCPEGSAFITSGYAPEQAPSFRDVNPPGVLLAPLGYSVAGVGATWLLLSLLTDDSERFPWLELAAGVAVGAAAYGLSAALDGPSAFAR